MVRLTERFDESIVLLRGLLGRNGVSYVRVKFVPKSREAGIDPGTLRHLEDLNRFDIDLYAFAERRLNEEIARHPSFDRDQASVRRMNSLYRQWGTVRHTIPKRLVTRMKG